MSTWSSKEGIPNSVRRSSVTCVYGSRGTSYIFTRVKQLSSLHHYRCPVAFAAPDLAAHTARSALGVSVLH